MRVTLTNTGAAPCRLTGDATFEYVDTTGTAVGEATRPGGGFGLLDPGEAITTTMRASSTDNYDEERCRPVPVAGIRVNPPADASPTTLTPIFPSTCTGGRPDVQPLTNARGQSNAGPGEGEGPG